MENRVVTCTTCPIGCSIEVIEDINSELGFTLKGYTCERGIDYAVAEVTNPTRVLTSTVKLKNSNLKRLPVRTDRAIPKNLIFQCVREINSVEVEAPVKLGDVIISNVLGIGVNIISSRTI